MLSGQPIDRRKAPRHIANGKLPGKLLIDSSSDEIICQALDVSRLGMGIQSELDIPMETRVKLLTEQIEIAFVVVSMVKHDEFGTTKRYGLLIENETIDLIEAFRSADCLAVTVQPSRHGPVDARAVRAPRYALNVEMHIQIKTVGSRFPYDLIVENLSRSGLLLAIAFDKNLPFRAKTLVEIIVDPDRKILFEPIHATGKIVRRIDEEATPASRASAPIARLGIAIVDIAPEHDQLWLSALESLEKSGSTVSL